MSDDGLGSEYRISLKSDSLQDTIPEDVAKKIKNMPETDDVYATKYTMGELQLSRNEFWQRMIGVIILSIKIKTLILSRDIMVSAINSKTEPIVLNTMYMAMMKR